MATPIVRRSNNQSSQSSTTGKSNLLPLKTRRFAAWAVEFTLLVISGLVPFGIGVYANSKSDLNRVPLHPVLVVTERTIAYPLALPVSYGTRNVAWVTNFFWSLAVLAPLGVSGWQLYLLAKTGSTMPKKWFGVRVVNEQGMSPGILAVGKRELIGRWTVPISVTYILWRNSFAFPNLGVFTIVAALIWLADATGFPKSKPRRAWHDRLAGTYTIDDTLPFTPEQLRNPAQWTDSDEEAAIASIVITPESQPKSSQKPSIWQNLQKNPSLSLIGMAIASIILVLGTLISTQIYIQVQQNRRAAQQDASQQFTSLFQKLSPKSQASDAEKRRAIAVMGTLNHPQAKQFLVNLLIEEANNPKLTNAIEQALVNLGPKVIPNLKRANQVISRQLGQGKNISAPEQKLKQQSLRLNIQVINKILEVHSGNTDGVDLNRAQLVTSNPPAPALNLQLNKVDVWGINFKYANLSQASFKGSRFRGAGKDGRWDTYDDWITDLSGAQMQQADLTNANLSRVLMVRTNLSRATLNQAHLFNARMVDANLSSSQLVGADLHGAVLENASLTGADLSDAKLNEADLYGARLGRAIAISAQLSHANLTNTDWQAADLSGANLLRANLRNANLSATRLKGAILKNANLENAKFRNADLSLADLRGANLAGADFQGTILTSGKQNPADRFVQTPSVGSESAVVQGVDFTEVKNLNPRQLAYICTQGALHPSCP
ncbi:MAG: pentapeptide repeat-containing protein [Calothrix sp. MO_192.B10]|nr:pentapeptide repeat-containing protein [Calothrix sp. MO_192.B10]